MVSSLCMTSGGLAVLSGFVVIRCPVTRFFFPNNLNVQTTRSLRSEVFISLCNLLNTSLVTVETKG